MKPFSMVIPYKFSPGIREENFQFVLSYYKKVLPEAEIILGVDNSHAESYNRALSIDNGVEIAEHDIVWINDGDIFISRENIERAFQLLDESPFIIPFGRCYDLTENKTRTILKHGLPRKLSKLDKHKYMVRDIRPGHGIFGLDKFAGGLQLFRKDFFYELGGMYSHRFKTWGWEDSWLCMRAMNRLGDYPILEDAVCYHLWHERVAPAEGWTANEGLFLDLCDKELD